MPVEDQLEVIGPGGDIRFFTLNTHKGITYLGSHAESDVVLEGPGSRPSTPCWTTGPDPITSLRWPTIPRRR